MFCLFLTLFCTILDTPKIIYSQRVASGDLQEDPSQQPIVAKLTDLYHRAHVYNQIIEKEKSGFNWLKVSIVCV